MPLSQTQLTAYLDDELTENERLQIEHQLAQSSESQARLDQLRREIAQMAHALDCLGPEQPPSAWLAWKRLRSHLPTASQPAPSDTPDSPASTSAVWESPSLLTTVRERIKQPWSTRPPLRQTRWQRKLFVGAVSTLLVLAIFIVGALLLGSPRTPLSAPEPQLPPEAVPVAATFSNTTPPGSITRPISTTQAIVALQPISQGAPFSAGAIGHREWPANNLPPNAIADEVEAIGQVAQTDIVQGQVIVRDMLAAATSATGVPNGDFGYGIQVDPQGNTTANIKHLKTLRMNWVKFQMPWREVEPDSGRYQWTDWDTLIEAYAAAGLNILLTIADAPHWSRPPEDSIDVDGFPQDAADYAQFVAQVADRYQGRVQAIEVWEEQNIYYSVGGQGRVDPAAYTDLLKQAYTAIKAVNPDMIVVSGGLAPTSAPPPMALDDVAYLRQLYANGAQPYLDAVGAHPLSFANPPDAFYQGGDFDPTRGYDDHRSFFFRNTMEAYRQVMVENGDEAKAIWPTDFGWAVRRTEDPRFEFAQENTPAEQAEYTLNAFEMGQTWGWVGPMFLGNLDYNLTAPDTGRANFGILNTPTYDALVTRGLGHQAVADLSPVAAGSDVVIVLDISGSMAAEDFAPNRLEATKSVIHNFVDTYQDGNIGYMTFAGQVVSRIQPTTDKELLAGIVDLTKLAWDIGLDSGTAIGDGLSEAIDMLQLSPANRQAVIFITDGTNNAGQVEPLTAAKEAAKLDIRVYMVGVAQEAPARLVFPDGRAEYRDPEIDEATLTAIANATGGDYFRAVDAAALQTIFEQIGKDLSTP